VVLGRSLWESMFLLVGPLVGFALGLLVRRWSVVAAAVVVIVVLSALGVPLGWFDSEDMEPLGGLIITAVFFEIPFLLCLGVGVWVRRSRAMRRHSVSR
jgi:hypothetical protein